MNRKHFLTCIVVLVMVSFCGPAFSLCQDNATLDDIIKTLPQRFDGDKNLSTTIRFKFQEDSGENTFYTAIISGGVCTVQDGRDASPQLIISCSSSVYLAIELGQMTPHEAIERGALLVNNRKLAQDFLQHFILYYQLCQSNIME
jgi:putative sterol carrier protein